MSRAYEATALADPERKFFFPCPTCHHVIDVTAATFCRCAVKRPTVACDRCGFCLCKAELSVVSDFWWRAPASFLDRNAAECKLRVVRSRKSGNNVDILVVDDDEEILIVTAFMAQEMGYSVMTASGAAEALELMERVRPRLVITDALMPKVDGRQLCRSIKVSFPEVRVVIMTALYTSARYKYEALKTFRADDYVSKPLDFQKIQELLHRLAPRPMKMAVQASVLVGLQVSA